jgi:hypothetical protein
MAIEQAMALTNRLLSHAQALAAVMADVRLAADGSPAERRSLAKPLSGALRTYGESSVVRGSWSLVTPTTSVQVISRSPRSDSVAASDLTRA